MFIFYDTETTGLDRDFSQILQIALVFTDDDLNILSMKKMECRRSPWVIPSPGAMLTTGFVPDDLKNAKLSHYEMMAETNSWIQAQHWPLLFSGYNTLKFDEPVMAQNLAQNLQHPDITTARNRTNGQANGRMDIMQLVRAATIYTPGVLCLTILNDMGTPSLSLGNVAQQNGVKLAPEDAHDAMNDVKATLGVAKMLKKTAPDLWRQMMLMSNVEGVNSFLAANSVFTVHDASYGRTRSAAVTSVTERAADNTQLLFNLALDPTPYMAMSVDDLAAHMSRKHLRDDSKPQPFILSDKKLQPILMPLSASDPVLDAKFDDALAQQRASDIQANKAFCDKVAQAAEQVRVEENKWRKRQHIEQWNDNPVDKALQTRVNAWQHEFHAAPKWEDRRDLIEDFYKRFDTDIQADPTLRRFPKFAGRVVFENAPEVLSDAQREGMMKHAASRALDPDLSAPYMTIAKARRELAQIERERNNQGSRWAAVTDSEIRSLKLYYTALEKEYAPFAAKPLVDPPAPTTITPPPSPKDTPPKIGG